jgi:hypothetical protein
MMMNCTEQAFMVDPLAHFSVKRTQVWELVGRTDILDEVFYFALSAYKSVNIPFVHTHTQKKKESPSTKEHNNHARY